MNKKEYIEAITKMLEETNGEIAQAALGRWKRVSRIVTP